MTDSNRILLVTHGGTSSRAGQVQRLSQAHVRIGRRPDNDIVFNPETDRAVSGHHAEITVVFSEERVVIRDLGSNNGTTLNGSPVEGEISATLPCDIRLGLNGPTLRLDWEVPTPAPLLPLTASGPEKSGIGAQTLERAIQTASLRERHRGRRALIALSGSLIIVFIVVWAAIDRHQAELKSEQLARLAGESSLKKDVAATKLVADKAGDRWSTLAKQYRESIFLCVAEDPAKNEGGIGTAFVVAHNVLATNAHVAKMLQEMPQTGVIQNHTGRSFAIKRLAIHPDFTTPMSPDVALIEIELEGATLTPMPLADWKDLQAMEVGTELGTLGYPGELGEAYFSGESEQFLGAVATFKTGRIGRMVNYDMAATGWNDCKVIQHSASLTGGTSGSPMFTSDGKVVALNNAGLDQEVMVSVEGAGVSPMRMANPAQIGLAVRVDVLREFMAKPTWAK